MDWKEKTFTIVRTVKEADIEVSGAVIHLAEVYNSNGKPLIFGTKATLTKNGKMIAERMYDPERRDNVVSELTRIAGGEEVAGIDPISGRTTFK